MTLEKRQLLYETKYSFFTIMTYTALGTILFVLDKKGMLSAYYSISEYGVAYWIASIFFIFIFHDCWFYWTHRILHHPFIYRHVHHIHHKSKHTTPFSAFSMHPLEAALLNVWLIPLAIFVPVHFPTFVFFQLISLLLNILGHLGYEVYPKGFTKGIFFWKTTVTHHQIHHSVNKKNFGLYFTFWDRWMSTESDSYQNTFDNLTAEK